jgi:uncharacterized protein (DUF58 family)
MNLPGHGWGRLAALLLVAGYLLRSIPLISIAAVMGVVLVAAAAWNKAALRSLFYQRRMRYRRGFPGESLGLEVVVENRKALPLAWLRISDRWPPEIGPQDETSYAAGPHGGGGALGLVLVMRGHERARRRFDLALRRRGIYPVGPAAALSGDPFGLYQTEGLVQPAQQLVVYPEILPAREMGLPPDDPFGDRKSIRRIFEDISQTVGVRDYLPGDSFRRIHWPATARFSRLQTRVHQPISGLDLVVCLNAATFPRHWEGTDPRLLEALVRAGASLVKEAFDRGYRVGLISNGSIAHADRPFRIPPGRSPGHLALLLEALAGLTPLVTVPFDRFLLIQAPRLEYGAGLVAVSAITSTALMESLLRLRARCRRVTLVSLADAPPAPAPGIEIIHAPALSRGGAG